jgi:hypothetical protein
LREWVGGAGRLGRERKIMECVSDVWTKCIQTTVTATETTAIQKKKNNNNNKKKKKK